MKLTPEQIARIIDFATQEGKKRAQTQGLDFSEEDYLAGVMTGFFAFEQQLQIPGGWIFGPIAGQPTLRAKRDNHPSRSQLLRDLYSLRAAVERLTQDVTEREDDFRLGIADISEYLSGLVAGWKETDAEEATR